MTKSRGILPPRKLWSEQDLSLLAALYPHQSTTSLAAALGRTVQAVYQLAMVRGIAKTPEFMASEASGRLTGTQGAHTRFRPGHVSEHRWQKGAHVSEATQFKKGHAPVNVQEVGALRINTLGDLEIKVAEGKNQWVSMRRYVWETEMGPIPPGMCIVPKNGDGHDTQIDNLQLVTRQENIAINLHNRYPKELRQLMQLGGRLRTQIAKSKENVNA